MKNKQILSLVASLAITSTALNAATYEGGGVVDFNRAFEDKNINISNANDTLLTKQEFYTKTISIANNSSLTIGNNVVGNQGSGPINIKQGIIDMQDGGILKIINSDYNFLSTINGTGKIEIYDNASTISTPTMGGKFAGSIENKSVSKDANLRFISNFDNSTTGSINLIGNFSTINTNNANLNIGLSDNARVKGNNGIQFLLQSANDKVNITSWNLNIGSKSDFDRQADDNGNEFDLNTHITFDGTRGGQISIAKNAIKVKLDANFDKNAVYDLSKVLQKVSFNQNQDPTWQVPVGVINADSFIDGDASDAVDLVFENKNISEFSDKNNNKNNPNYGQNSTTPGGDGGGGGNTGGVTITTKLNEQKAASSAMIKSSGTQSLTRALNVRTSSNAFSSSLLGNATSASLNLAKVLKNSPYFAAANSDYMDAKQLQIARERINQSTQTEFYAMPFANYTDLGDAYGKSGGVILGAGRLLENGVLMGYLGTEWSKYSYQTQDVNDNTIHLGGSYLYEFDSEIYTRVALRLSFSNNDIKRANNSEANADNYSFGGALNLGKRFEIDKEKSFKLEGGLGADYYSLGAFNIDNENYHKSNFVVSYTELLGNFENQISENDKLSLGLGTRVNLSKKVKADVDVAGLGSFSVSSNLASVYGFGELGYTHDFGNDFSLGMIYSLLVAKDLNSHTGYLKAAYKF